MKNGVKMNEESGSDKYVVTKKTMEAVTAESFDKELIEFHFLTKDFPFKGLSKEYILDAIFNDKIQAKWKPQVGDIIVGCTGNIFVIGGEHLLEGDTLFFYGDGLCNRDGGGLLDVTHCSTLNESGSLENFKEDVRSWKDFRFVPYPHETDRM